MTNETKPSATNSQIIHRLATEVMGWNMIGNGIDECLWDGSWDGSKKYDTFIWNPLTDWNHWRQVEEKVIGNDVLYGKFILEGNYMFVREYVANDLPTRCRALLAALDSK